MYGATFAHGYAGTRSYGEIWWPKTGRLAKCPAMQDAYEEFLLAREAKKACKGCFWGIGKGCSCRKKYEDRMESLERKGDAAWTLCKVAEERIEVVEQEAYESGWSPTTTAGPAYVDVGPTTQQLVDQQIAYEASLANLAAQGTAGTTTTGTNWMLYAGLGVAGLAAVLLMRK